MITKHQLTEEIVQRIWDNNLNPWVSKVVCPALTEIDIVEIEQGILDRTNRDIRLVKVITDFHGDTVRVSLDLNDALVV